MYIPNPIQKNAIAINAIKLIKINLPNLPIPLKFSFLYFHISANIVLPAFFMVSSQ